MKRVGILTFHYADNYGAVLQVYALRKMINSIPEYEAEIINYVPDSLAYYPYINTKNARQNLISKRKKFQQFLKEQCGLDKPIISSLNGNDYDYYCVGSDQVWNKKLSTEEYFLPNVDAAAVKIAYAASIGMSITDADFDDTLFKKYLPQFRSISVREKMYTEFVSNITGKECPCVLDPTLLLDCKEYESLLVEHKERAPFLFLFWINENDLFRGVELANNIARKYNLNIIHSIVDAKPYMLFKDGGCMYYEGVEDFLWYIKNAKIVVTDSYHATLFSIQFRTPFYTLINPDVRSRIDTICEMLDLNERVISSYLPFSRINLEVDFTSIWKNIYIQREKSMQYLFDNLEVGKD